jgi:hypothetical protein
MSLSKKLALIIMLTGVSSCQSNLDDRQFFGDCLLFKPIYWSSKDTAKTIVQIKSHNAVGKDACAWVNNNK